MGRRLPIVRARGNPRVARRVRGRRPESGESKAFNRTASGPRPRTHPNTLGSATTGRRPTTRGARCAHVPESVHPMRVVGGVGGGGPGQSCCRGSGFPDPGHHPRSRLRPPFEALTYGNYAAAAAALPRPPNLDLRLNQLRQEPPRVRLGNRRDLLRRARREHSAAPLPALGAEVDDVVGGLDHVEVVLDHDDGVAGVDKSVKHVEQALDVGEVEAGRRLVEDVRGSPPSRPSRARSRASPAVPRRPRARSPAARGGCSPGRRR